MMRQSIIFWEMTQRLPIRLGDKTPATFSWVDSEVRR
jgi:hypothetical protein